MSTAAPNPIEKRLERMVEQWDAFISDPEPRLLCWQGTAEELRMVEVFEQAESLETSETPEMFFRLDAAFSDPKTHGFALVQEIEAQYQEVKAGVEADRIKAAESVEDDSVKPEDKAALQNEMEAYAGMEFDWMCPQALPDESDRKYLVRVAESFLAHHSQGFQHVVFLLTPVDVADGDAWQRWLFHLVEKDTLPEGVRVVVVDSLQSPTLDWLAATGSSKLGFVPLNLDMKGAAQEAAEAVEGEGPGDEFRKLFTAMTAAAGEGDLPKTQALGDKALALTQAQNWPQLEFGVWLALSAAYFGKQQGEKAYRGYVEAEKSALKLKTSEGNDMAESAEKFQVQARFGQAAVMVEQERWAEAALLYEETAPIAESAGDALMLLECWRMAAYGYERTKQWPKALEGGRKAVAVGEGMKPEERKHSTLAYAGEGLLRVARPDDAYYLGYQIDDKMRELLGPDWRERAKG